MEEYMVIMEKLCSCAKKQDLAQIETFKTQKEAEDAAKAKLGSMKSSFCGKHEFDITEVNDHYVIGMLSGCGCSKSKSEEDYECQDDTLLQ